MSDGGVRACHSALSLQGCARGELALNSPSAEDLLHWHGPVLAGFCSGGVTHDGVMNSPSDTSSEHPHALFGAARSAGCDEMTHVKSSDTLATCELMQ
jgi:hypothetical protein